MEVNLNFVKCCKQLYVMYARSVTDMGNGTDKTMFYLGSYKLLCEVRQKKIRKIKL